MIRIYTIGEHIDHAVSVTACCYGCHRYVVLDLERLAAKLGRDHSSMHDALVPKLRCDRCGRNDQVGLIVSPINTGPAR